MEQIAHLRQTIAHRENQHEFYGREMSRSTNYKYFERKTKKRLREEMIARPRELRDPETGWGTIADAINDEFHTRYSRSAIQDWLKPEMWRLE